MNSSVNVHGTTILKGDNVSAILDRAMDAGEGLLQLTPTWVPRSFLHPGKRIKLHPDDWYAYGAERGGIDERWFGSTTEAANEGRVWHESFSFVSFEGEQFLLKGRGIRSGQSRRWRDNLQQIQPLARLLEVPSTIWARSHITCTSRLKTPRWSGKKENRKAITSRSR